MSHKNHGLRAFGLTLIAALGLMAFMAVGAQANWLYLEGGAAKELTAKEEVKVSQHESGVGTLLYEGNGGVLIEVTCKTLKGEDLLLLPGNATTAEATGSVAFSECKTSSNGSPAPECDPKNEPIKAGGSAKIILHSSKNYVLFSPPEGGAFAEIKFDPATCALTSTNKVKGNTVAECGLLSGGSFVQNDCAEHMTFGLLRQASEALFPSDVLKFGNKTAKIDGIARVELAGTHAGQAWSGEV